MNPINYQLSIDETLQTYQTNASTGLNQSDVTKRQEVYGTNQLNEGKKRPLILKFFDQINDFMIYILLGASVISFFTHEVAEGFLIIAIVLINAFLGLLQESRAEKALASIKALSSPHAKVLRDGKEQLVDVKDMTVGDIVMLDAGDYMPADVRLIEAINLKVDESTLTGEAVPVEKQTDMINAEEVSIGDRTNLGFMGTVVTYGRGKAVVVSVGMKTELGKIATMLTETKDEDTPLQKSMASLGKTLAFIALGIVIVIFAITMIETYITTGELAFDVFREALLTAIALAVAAIPEGLPAIITIVLALGMQNLVKKKAIIRTLPAVETLGSTSIICSDKTGTLTQNLMTVTKVFTHLGETDMKEAMTSNETLDELARFGVLCNDTKVSVDHDQFIKIGDPTEIAFIDLAIMLQVPPLETFKNYPRRYELPFDSERKLMTTVHDFKKGRYAVIKGAPDVIFKKTKAIFNDDLSSLHTYEEANQNMANQALRVLAVAFKKIDASRHMEDLKHDDLENDLTLVGLVGMIDPARPEVKDAITVCNTAGIKTIMITGDHINTAVAIAKDLKILGDGEFAITGKDLDHMDDETFMMKLQSIRVYARVSPENKVRIVEAWQQSGQIVAMTGDGVNDAPSIKRADIGIAKGITGTEVAKGAADMVLTDDNFTTIVTAVGEGRTIFSNIKKATHYLLSCNIGEIVAIFLGTTLGLLIFGRQVTTLTAVQILWVNLVTDSLMAIALGLEPREKNVMADHPRDPKKSIFAGGLGYMIALQGVMIGLIAFAAYYIGWQMAPVGFEEITAETMTFMVLALSQLVHAFNVRSQYGSVFSLKKNVWIFYAFITSAMLQVMVVLLPFGRNIFGLIALSGYHWLVIIGLAILPLLFVEIYKRLKKR